MLTPTYSIISYWNGIFYLCLFYLGLLSGTQLWQTIREWCTAQTLKSIVLMGSLEGPVKANQVTNYTDPKSSSNTLGVKDRLPLLA
jgi:hypothetical protein